MFSKKKKNAESTDRQTDTVFIGKKRRATWNPKFDSFIKAHGAKSSVTKDDLTEPKQLLQFPAQPSLFLGLMEITTEVIQVFKGNNELAVSTSITITRPYNILRYVTTVKMLIFI